MPDLNVLAAYNCVDLALGGSGTHPNDMVAVRAIAVLEGVSGGPVDIREDNMVLRLNAIDAGVGGAGNHENDLDALNSIALLAGDVGGHLNSLDAINAWCDNAFVGILDGVLALSAWSPRRLSSPYIGSPLRVRRSSDNAEQDQSFLSNGDLDTVAMEAFCGAGDGFVVTWYDQSGNGRDQTQATDSLQPRIVNSGTTEVANIKPTLNFNLDILSGSTDDVEDSDFAVLVVVDDFVSNNASMASKGDDRIIFCGGSVAGWGLGTVGFSRYAIGATDNITCESGSFATGENFLHTVVGTFELGVEALLRIDGVVRRTLDLSSIGDMTNAEPLNIGEGVTNWEGFISEVIIVPLADFAAIETDMISTYST